ncbi:hypothetical protein PoMZ_13368 [Pyricularia oryzae]|uniref:Secreted protein n=1 Tax=Pyricularia oryzae TaxID=318829 RepID=A0A4P7NVB4_PYROR|nr:hypothetical protein PoMZ_13368 [Pyricularia oryzae]
MQFLVFLFSFSIGCLYSFSQRCATFYSRIIMRSFRFTKSSPLPQRCEQVVDRCGKESIVVLLLVHLVPLRHAPPRFAQLHAEPEVPEHEPPYAAQVIVELSKVLGFNVQVPEHDGLENLLPKATDGDISRQPGLGVQQLLRLLFLECNQCI